MSRRKTKEYKPNAIWRVFRYLRFYPREITLNILFNLMAVLFNLMSFVLIVPVIEIFFGSVDLTATEPEFALNQRALTEWMSWHVQEYKSTVGLWPCLLTFCGAYVASSLLYNLCRYLGLYFLSPIRNGVLCRLRNDIYYKITILPLSYFTHRHKGDIISRMSADLADIEWSIVSTLQSLVKDPINIVVFAATLIFISPKLFALFLLVLPPAVWLIGKIGQSLKRNSISGQQKLGTLMTAYKETLDNMEVVKAYNREEYRQEVFEQANTSYSDRMMRVARRREAGSPLSEILGTIGLAFILVLGGNAVVGGSLQASVFILFVIIFARLIPPVQAIVKAYSSLQKGSASAKRIFEIIDADEKIVEKPDALDIREFVDSIEFDNVSFAYTDNNGTETEVLHNINLKIRRGTKVAIVGPSGAGKTTLADMLPRFYDPTNGRITIDGTDLRDLNIDSLRHLVGVVSQNCILFNDTIANNIAFGLAGVTQQQIEAAARMAHADEFIAAMPQGYDTPVGDKGSALSGGQRQRISIARAILRNAPILILDEATSALDNESQTAVQQAVDNLMEGRTTIVIAHRLSTIENADVIVVLNAGTIAEQGTHAELMSRNGLYKEMAELQKV